VKKIVLILGLLFVSIISHAVYAVDVKVGGEYRLRFENREPTNFNQAGPTDRFVLQRTRINFDGKFENGVGFFAEIQDSRTWGNETSTLTQMSFIDLHQGYFTFGKDVKWKLGRQELVYGKQRLLGATGWSNIGRSFDAVKTSVPFFGRELDVFYAKVSENATTTVQGDNVDLAGLYFKGEGFEPYLLNKNDLNLQSNRSTLGARLFGDLAGGKFDLEGMYQTGGIGAKTIAAYAGAVNFAYPVMAGALLNVEMNYASGDDNAADNTVKTFDQLYPTNHGKYGLADIVGFQNLLSYRAEVQLNVFEKSQLMLGVVLLNKAEANDFVYSSTGVKHAQDAGNTETAIGSEYFIHYQTQLEDNIGFNAGLSLFNPGKALNGTASQTWSYVQTSLKF
jgi:hypothetical protein